MTRPPGPQKDGKLSHAVHLQELAFRKVDGRIETGDFGGHPGIQRLGARNGQRRNRASPVHEPPGEGRVQCPSGDTTPIPVTTTRVTRQVRKRTGLAARRLGTGGISSLALLESGRQTAPHSGIAGRPGRMLMSRKQTGQSVEGGETDGNGLPSDDEGRPCRADLSATAPAEDVSGFSWRGRPPSASTAPGEFVRVRQH